MTPRLESSPIRVQRDREEDPLPPDLLEPEPFPEAAHVLEEQPFAPHRRPASSAAGRRCGATASTQAALRPNSSAMHFESTRWASAQPKRGQSGQPGTLTRCLRFVVELMSRGLLE
ncbi:MAG: hypothetical protein B7Z66_08125 [Chromatiales bacterium 21-64-14]|nr:MAG: hypothetical protein B7Z66_08125 [Chromatiales bacterium 21-64-14]